jgi:hypothetical protein
VNVARINQNQRVWLRSDDVQHRLSHCLVMVIDIKAPSIDQADAPDSSLLFETPQTFGHGQHGPAVSSIADPGPNGRFR